MDLLCSSDNDFVVILELPEGEHEYKFQIDGRWEYDLNEVEFLLFILSIIRLSSLRKMMVKMDEITSLQ